LHEHPSQASSWAEEEIQKLANEENVRISVADQCQYGLTTWSHTKGIKDTPARKTTKFMTNSDEIARELSRRCDGAHKHQQLLEGRAKEAQVWPEELCKAICQGLIREIQMQEQEVKLLLRLNHFDKIEEEGGKRKDKGIHDDEEEPRWDDVSGIALRPSEVMKARMKEIGYINGKKGVA